MSEATSPKIQFHPQIYVAPAESGRSANAQNIEDPPTMSTRPLPKFTLVPGITTRKPRKKYSQPPSFSVNKQAANIIQPVDDRPGSSPPAINDVFTIHVYTIAQASKGDDTLLDDTLSSIRTTGRLDLTVVSAFLATSVKPRAAMLMKFTRYYRFVAELMAQTQSGALKLNDYTLAGLADMAFSTWKKVMLLKPRNPGKACSREEIQNENELKVNASLEFLKLVHRHPLMISHFEKMNSHEKENFLDRTFLKCKFACLQWLATKEIRLSDSELESLNKFETWGYVPPESLWESIRYRPPVPPFDARTETPVDTGPDSHIGGQKTRRQSGFGDDDLPVAKWPRYEAYWEPAACSDDWHSATEPEEALHFTEMGLPSTEPALGVPQLAEADWMEAQSRYLNAVLWQDES